MDEQLLDELRKWLELPRVSVINPKPAKQLIGTVTVEADEIIVHDLKKLCKLLARMRNMEIYSLPNGKVYFAAVFPDVFTVSTIES